MYVEGKIGEDEFHADGFSNTPRTYDISDHHALVCYLVFLVVNLVFDLFPCIFTSLSVSLFARVLLVYPDLGFFLHGLNFLLLLGWSLALIGTFCLDWLLLFGRVPIWIW